MMTLTALLLLNYSKKMNFVKVFFMRSQTLTLNKMAKMILNPHMTLMLMTDNRLYYFYCIM